MRGAESVLEVLRVSRAPPRGIHTCMCVKSTFGPSGLTPLVILVGNVCEGRCSVVVLQPCVWVPSTRRTGRPGTVSSTYTRAPIRCRVQ